MTLVKLTLIKAVNVNQFRLFIVIIKNALQVSEIVIFVKPAHGRTGPPGFSQAARRPSPPLADYRDVHGALTLKWFYFEKCLER